MLPIVRFRALVVGLVAWAALVVVRLGYVQVAQHNEWAAEAADQQERTQEIKEVRGDIVTRNGRLLAGSLERVTVCVNPDRIPAGHRAAVAAQLAPLVGMSAGEVTARLGEHDAFLYLARDLDPQAAAAVARLGQRGIWTERTQRRVYPHGTLAGPVVGFVDGNNVGQAGLEAFYERTLQGTPSRYRLLRDGKKTLPTNIDKQLEEAGRPGLCLRLSLDSRAQTVAEQELARTLGDVGGKGAAAVVMDPYTGQLLALASLPSYDPTHPADAIKDGRRNRAVEDALEPGSVFKPFVVAAAISSGVLDPYEMVDCSGGGVQVANAFIRDHATYGLLSVRDLLAYSSNTGAIRIAHRLSPSQLDGFIRQFGFGRTTGVELPAETRGIYRPPERWSALSRAGLALGEEISVNLLQVAQGYSAIANGGVLVHPTLVLGTADRYGKVVSAYKPAPAKRVLTPEIAHQVAGMLTAVVDAGTGKAAAVPGYAIAGKTGTAQKAVGSGGYGAGRHAAWFAGFVPAENPRLVIVVCVDEPSATYWAAEVAAPAFSRIAARLTTLLGITPSSGETL